MNIEFDCEGCHQRLAIDEKYSGMQAICPKCKKEMTIPAGSRARELYCPNCNVILEKGAVFCFSCGLNLITGKKN